MDLHSFSDIHTHVAGRPDSILSIPPCEVEGIHQYFSLQLHPWHLPHKPAELEAELSQFHNTALQLRQNPLFVAIGECGLDGHCETPLDIQQQAFVEALHVSRELNLPVIIHCVKLWSELLNIAKTFPMADSDSRYIIHGFRKGPQLAQQLIDAGFCISLGKHYHPDIPNLIPPDRLYHETDDL